MTLNIEDEHRLHETSKEPDVSLGSTWLSDFPQAWAETGGMGLAVVYLLVLVNDGACIYTWRINGYCRCNIHRDHCN